MFTTEELMAVDPAEFAAAVARTPDHELAEGMASVVRTQVLDEVFRRMEAHFDPSKSKKLDIVIHFELTGRPDGQADRYQVTIRDNACKVSKEATDDPGLTLTLDAVDFLKLATNNANGMNLYIGGRLKVKGNLILATRLQGLFFLPDAATASASAGAAAENVGTATPSADAATASVGAAPATGQPTPSANPTQQ